MNAILASTFDRQEINSIKSLARELCENTIGAREAYLWDPEISMLCSLLYYTISISAMFRTLGLEYAHLKIIPNDHKDMRSPTIRLNRMRTLFRWLPVIFALIPYAEARKLDLYSCLKRAVMDLITEESTTHSSEHQEEQQQSVRDRGGLLSHCMLMLRCMLLALSDCWMRCAADDSLRLQLAMSFLKDSFICAFFLIDDRL